MILNFKPLAHLHILQLELEDYVDEQEAMPLVSRQGKQWEPKREAILFHFSAVYHKEAGREGLRLRDTDVACALADHVPGTFGDAPSLSQGLRCSMPPGVPAHSVPLQWTTGNQRLRAAQNTVPEAAR